MNEAKRRTVKYEEEPVDDLSLPDDAEILTRGKKVMLKPKRGGPRPGAGRKPKGHLRMQVLVSKRAKDKIRRLAKERGVSISALVSKEFENYKV